MKTLKNTEKDILTELAWKKLIEAIKPVKSAPFIEVNSARQRDLSHPALIRTGELSHWEMFE